MTNFRMARRWAAFAILSAFALTACSLPSLPGSGKPPELYDLTPKSTFSDDLPNVDWQLIVEVPTAPAGLDTNRIAVRETATKISYIKDVTWIDRLPNLVQTLLVESFENSGRIVAVGRESVGLRADYVLKLDVREFQLERGSGKDRVNVRISAKLVRMPERVIIGATTAAHSVDITSTSIAIVIGGFDDSLGKVLKKVVEWSLTLPSTMNSES
jgi:cholesterol transport system auxiliary component